MDNSAAGFTMNLPRCRGAPAVYGTRSQTWNGDFSTYIYEIIRWISIDFPIDDVISLFIYIYTLW